MKTNEQLLKEFRSTLHYNHMGWAKVSPTWEWNRIHSKARNIQTGKIYNWTLDELIIEQNIIKFST